MRLHYNSKFIFEARHVTHAWVVSYMNESHHIEAWGYITIQHPYVKHNTSHMNGSCRTHMSHVIYAWGYIATHNPNVRHVTSHMNGSCRIRMRRLMYDMRLHYNAQSICEVHHVTYEWAVSYMNESHHICRRLHSHTQSTREARHVTHEWAVSYMDESHHVICTYVASYKRLDYT